MAESIGEGRWPEVVPWGLEIPAQASMAQPLFPPGFPLLAALAGAAGGGARGAVDWLPRLAAALLPCLLLLGFRGLCPDPLLFVIGVALLFTQGVWYWHYVGYSDVPGLALAIAALGFLWQADALAVSNRRLAGRRALVAGLLAGACYLLRNAGLAVIGASLALLVVGALCDRARRPILRAWLLGLGPVVVLLKGYDLVMFGSFSPYAMPPSTRPLGRNLADWIGAQVADLQLLAPDAGLFPLLAALAILVGALSGAAAGLYLVRDLPRPRAALGLLLCYVALGGAMLVASRSTYEWGGPIDTRYALQYTFALLLCVGAVADARLRGAARRIAAVLAVLGAIGLATAAVDTALAERREPEPSRELVGDARLTGVLRALPGDVWIASNEAALWRVELGRRVRQSDFIGDDAELARHLEVLERRVRPQALAFVLVCEEWTRAFRACTGGPLRTDVPGCAVVRDAAPSLDHLTTGALEHFSGKEFHVEAGKVSEVS